MPRPRTVTAGIDLTERATFYEVSESTIRRWIAAGVDINDLESVATHLLKQRAPAVQPLETLNTELQ